MRLDFGGVVSPAFGLVFKVLVSFRKLICFYPLWGRLTAFNLAKAFVFFGLQNNVNHILPIVRVGSVKFVLCKLLCHCVLI